MKKSAWKSIAAGAACALALTACSPAPSTVSVVAGERITESDIDHLIESCKSVGYGEQLNRAGVVLNKTLGDALEKGLVDQEFVFPEDQARQIAIQELGPEALADETCGPYLLNAGRFSFSLTAMQQSIPPEDFKARFSAIFDQIQLNPRYGRMKRQPDGQLALASGSLSSLIEAAQE